MKVRTSRTTPPVPFMPITITLVIESRPELEELVQEIGLTSGGTYPLYKALSGFLDAECALEKARE